MAEIVTDPLTRDDISAHISKNQRVIRFFENLSVDVTETIPGYTSEALAAAAAAQASANSAQATADGAVVLANDAQATADGAQADADEALERASHLQLSRPPLAQRQSPQAAQFILAARSFSR